MHKINCYLCGAEVNSKLELADHILSKKDKIHICSKKWAIEYKNKNKK